MITGIQLQAAGDVTGVNLSGNDMFGLEFSGVNLAGADFKGGGI